MRTQRQRDRVECSLAALCLGLLGLGCSERPGILRGPTENVPRSNTTGSPNNATTNSDATLNGGSSDSGGYADAGVGNSDPDGRPQPSALAGNCPGPAQTAGHLGTPQLSTSFGGGGGWFGSPQALDIDGDGAKEIVASGDGVAMYTLQGVRLWHNKTNGRVFAGAVLANFSKQGLPAVVAADKGGYVRAWKADGTQAAGHWPMRVAGSANNEIRSLAAADLDNDGVDEIIAFSQLTDNGNIPTMYAIDSDGSVMPGWPQYQDVDSLACTWCGGFNQNVAVFDLEGNGVPDIVFNQDMFYEVIFDARANPRPADASFTQCGKPLDHWGQVKAYLEYEAEFQRACGDYTHILEFTFSPPTIADLDHDGVAEILSVPNSHHKDGLNGTAGSALTVYEPDRTQRAGFAPYKASNGSLYSGEGGLVEFTPTAVAANFVGDENLEILATQLDGVAYLYDSNGKKLWQTTWSTTRNAIVTEPVVADLDGDGVPEAVLVVAFPDGTSTVLVLNGAKKKVMLSFDLDYQVVAAPLLDDVDNDGELELVLSAFDHSPGIYVYDWPGTSTNCLLWTQGRGNPKHTGSYLR